MRKGDEVMGKKKHKTAPRTNTEIWQNMRRDWGAINPVTKVIPDKRRKAPKHKGKELD